MPSLNAYCRSDSHLFDFIWLDAFSFFLSFFFIDLFLQSPTGSQIKLELCQEFGYFHISTRCICCDSWKRQGEGGGERGGGGILLISAKLTF